MTVSDLIKGSLRLIGAIASGETPSSAEQTDAVFALNQLLETWAIEGLTVFKTDREVFSLVGSQQAYTMGTGGNFNSARPSRIVRAAILDGTTEHQVDIINVDRWANISQKSTTSTLPQYLYAEGTAPLETVNLWPIPSEAKSIVLYSLKPLGAYVAADTLELPPGYTKALQYNLALDLAPEYGRDPSALVAMTAQETKTLLMRQNTQEVIMDSEISGMGRSSFNINTGE